MPTRMTLLAVTLLLAFTSAARGAASADQTRKLIAILQSGAPLFDKARACQQLGEFGTPEAVPPLASLLPDSKLSAYARSGLEGIAHPSAAAALREAASKLNGPLLAGVVNSLGVIQDEQATEQLVALANNPAQGVVTEALLALGNIATPEAIRALQAALTSAAPSARNAAASACLLAADRQRSLGNFDRALAVYDALRQPDVPLACRVGATRGAILARRSGRVPFLIEQLRSSEPPIRHAALLTIRDVPEDALASALNAEIGRAAPDLQEQLLLALADCHNVQSLAVIQSLTDSSAAQIRRTALSVLGRIGSDAGPALVTALQKKRPPEERAILRSGLRSIASSSLDELLLQALTSAADPVVRVDLIQLLEARGVTAAAPVLLKQANESEKEVRLAACVALKSVASPEELPGLISLTKASTDTEIRDATEDALAGICRRGGDKASDMMLSELKHSTTAAERSSWIRVLARVGYDGALPAIEAAVRDADPVVARTALTELGRWPNPGPVETLLTAMNSGDDAKLRQLALASLLDLATTAVDETQAAPASVNDWLGKADLAARATPEKLRIVSLLGRVKTIESLSHLEKYLDDPDLRAEAAAAIVQVAPALLQSENTSAGKSALAKVAQAEVSPELRDRAKQAAKGTSAAVAATRLFDGQSLQGWEGDTNVWRVQDGIIVGGSMKGNPRNEFLVTTRTFTNFVLRLEYKLVGTEGFVNSGVQFRSVRIANPPNEMSGYQADIGAGMSGILYDESRRNTILARPTDEAVKRIEKPGDWNVYEIRAEGTHIQLWLNGEKTVDYAELDGSLPQRGAIGLQIHGGNKAEISFRNITIREL